MVQHVTKTFAVRHIIFFLCFVRVQGKLFTVLQLSSISMYYCRDYALLWVVGCWNPHNLLEGCIFSSVFL